jgi:hypothetical protein
MATLQSFQAEIEDIRNRELAKNRTHPQPDVLRKPHADHKPAAKVRKRAVGGDVPTTPPVVVKVTRDEPTQDVTDIERSLQARYSCTSPYFCSH